jgi:hypothetical protein
MINKFILKMLHAFRPAGTFCAAALLLAGSAPPAAGEPRNELSAHGGGGLSALRYTLPYGKYTAGLGYDAGLGYTRFVGKRTGVSLGVSLSSHSATAQLDSATFVLPSQRDAEGNSYDLHVKLLRYREQQQATFVHIPLMLSYHRNRRRSSLYAQAGLQLSLPLSARYESRNATLHSEGYYPDIDLSIQESRYNGFGKFDGRNAEGTLNLKVAYTAAAEVGVRWRLSSAFSLYTGLFAGYGLSNALRSPGGESLMRPNAAAPQNFTTGSVLASRYTADNQAVDRLSLLSAGLKVRIAVDFYHFHNISISTQLQIKNWEFQHLDELLKLEQQKQKLEQQKQKEEVEK